MGAYDSGARAQGYERCPKVMHSALVRPAQFKYFLSKLRLFITASPRHVEQTAPSLVMIITAAP
jgi:hypothetical protein